MYFDVLAYLNTLLFASMTGMRSSPAGIGGAWRENWVWLGRLCMCAPIDDLVVQNNTRSPYRDSILDVEQSARRTQNGKLLLLRAVGAFNILTGSCLKAREYPLFGRRRELDGLLKNGPVRADPIHSEVQVIESMADEIQLSAEPTAAQNPVY